MGLQATNDSPTPLGRAATLTATVLSGTNLLYTWALGDGAVAEGAVVSHTYPAVGVYTATVTAGNALGWQVATTTVRVEEAVAPRGQVYLPLVLRGFAAGAR